MRLIATLLATIFLTLSTSAIAQPLTGNAAKARLEEIKSGLTMTGQQWETACDAFLIIQRFACETGGRLVGKRRPQNGCYPVGHAQGYSYDVIAYPTGWFDLLINAGPPDNHNTPAWNLVAPSSAKLFEPFGCQMEPEPLTPEPPPPLPSIDLTPLLNRMQELGVLVQLTADQTAINTTLIETLRAELRAHAENEDKHWAAADAVWKKILLYVVPSITAIVSTLVK